MRLTTAYAILVNGGKKVTPTLIDRIQDRRGKTLFRHDDRPCEGCVAQEWDDQSPPVLPDTREEVISPQTAYQIVSMLEGVVLRGTARRVAEVGVPLAGKTGTSNEERDTWFIGFSPNLAVGVFVGFDEPRPMGKSETGGKVAAPIFRDFMMDAIGDQPGIPFRIPPGINLVRVNAKTGELASPGETDTILEAFKAGTEPQPGARSATIGVGDGGVYTGEATPPASLGSGTGGLY